LIRPRLAGFGVAGDTVQVELTEGQFEEALFSIDKNPVRNGETPDRLLAKLKSDKRKRIIKSPNEYQFGS